MNRRTDCRHWNVAGPGGYSVWLLVLAFGRIATAQAQATTGVALPAAGANPGLAITLRVYNYARVPAWTLRAAERGTAMIFRETGVETVWIDCRVSTAEPQTPACKQPLNSPDLSLKLLPPSMEGDVASDRDTFGLAVPEKDRPGTDAMILYGRIAEMATTEYLYTEDILAAVMAHEIGHLLLGGGHSPTGIMRANLNRRELLETGQGRLQFTPEQSLLIRDEVAARRANRNGRGK